jgi:hypothetical protein
MDPTVSEVLPFAAKASITTLCMPARIDTCMCCKTDEGRLSKWRWLCRTLFRTARRSRGPQPLRKTSSRRLCPLWPPILARCRTRCNTGPALASPVRVLVTHILSRGAVVLAFSNFDKGSASHSHMCTSYAGTEDDQGRCAAAVICRNPSVAPWSPLLFWAGRACSSCAGC